MPESRLASIVVSSLVSALSALSISACSEHECPAGFTKISNQCKRDDAGADRNADTRDLETDMQRDPTLVGDAMAPGEVAHGEAGAQQAGAQASSDASTSAVDATIVESGTGVDASGATSDAGTGGVDTGLTDARADAVVSCGAGHVLKNGACTDVDECFEGTHQCHMTSTCKNTEGGYDCTCPLGYSGGTSAGFACASRIVVGAEHACVLLLDSTVQCWGKNTYGQLGDGTQLERAIPVTVAGLPAVAALNAGGQHTCALLRDGTVRCWGGNNSGKLGDGTMMNRATPVVVSGLENVVAVSTSAYNHHSCAVQQSGAVKCWGANDKGQLGTGTAAATPSPTPVGAKGITSAANVFVGGEQTCVALRNGVTQCWGEGFLGVRPISTSLVPLTIDIPSGVRSIEFSYRHACSLQLSGHVYCWGADAAGGNGTAGGDGLPAFVIGTSATAVTLGFYSTFIIRPDRSLAWWDLGTTPTEAAGFPRVVAIDSLFAQGSAITEDGRVISWTVNNPNGGASLTQPVTVSGLDLW